MKNTPTDFLVESKTMPTSDYPYSTNRFVIVDATDKTRVLDDAQGYGYKTYQNALKAGWYKFGGGKKKTSTDKVDVKALIALHPGIVDAYNDIVELNFKNPDLTDVAIAQELSTRFGVSVSPKLLKHF